MNFYDLPSSYDSLKEIVPTDASREAALAESDFYEELIDALNHNFVLEVEAGLNRKD